MAAVSPDSSFNTAVSFATNTNWQGYGGESTMSYLTQMLGAGGAELLLGRDRHRGAGRADPRLRARARRRRRRQLLGRPDAQRRSTSCCRSRSCSRCCSSRRAWSRTSTPTRRDDARATPISSRSSATASRQGRQGQAVIEDVHATQTLAMGPVASQVAIKHAGHQRRRLLQRQLGASVREPDAAVELLQMLSIFADPGGAVLHASAAMVGDTRQGWAVLAAMIGDLRRRCCWSCVSAGAGGQSRARRARRRSGAERAAAGRQHGRQGGALRHRRLGAVRRRRPRPRPTARSTRCTTRSRRWAAWCRCG